MRLSPASVETLQKIRGSHHTEFPYPDTPVALFYNIVYSKNNMRLITNVLDDICSVERPISLRLAYPFWDKGTKSNKASIYYDIASKELLKLRRESTKRLGGIETVEPTVQSGNFPRKCLIRDQKFPCFKPKVAVRHQVPREYCDQLVGDFERKFSNAPVLTVVGLSLGPKTGIDWMKHRADVLQLEPPPWTHFTFSATE